MIWTALWLLLLLAPSAHAHDVFSKNVVIQEEDGDPKGVLRTLKTTNDSLTRNNAGDYSLNIGSGLTGSGTNTYCTYWTGATSLGSDAGCTFNAATDSLSLTGTLTVNGAGTSTFTDPVAITETFAGAGTNILLDLDATQSLAASALYGQTIDVFSTHSSGTTTILAGITSAASPSSNSAVTAAFGFRGGVTVVDTYTPAISLVAGLYGLVDCEDAACDSVASGLFDYPIVDTGSMTRAWAAYFDGDTQISSDKKLIYEGAFLSTKGDTYHVYDSVGLTLDTVVNGAEMVNISSTVGTLLNGWDASAAKLEVPNATSLTSTDCDAAAEAGRVFVDTDATSGAQWYVCEGSAGWVLSSGGPTGFGTVANQVAYWSTTTNLAGSTNLTFTPSDPSVGGILTLSGALPYINLSDSGSDNMRLLANSSTFAILNSTDSVYYLQASILHAILLGDALVPSLTVITDGTGTSEVVLPAGAIDGTEILDDTVTLTTDTNGSYAGGDAEAGNALTGDSATSFFNAGQIETARGGTGDDTSATTGIPRIDSGNWTYAELSGDVATSGSNATVIGNDKILEAMLKVVDAASDEECLTYETTTGDFEWQTCGGASGNSFETWVIPDTNNIVADSATDTATFTESAGIDITGTTATDTINFALDLTELSTTTLGAGAFTTLTFNAGAIDPVITAASNMLTVTTGNFGVGTDGATLGKMGVDGTANTTQLVVQGFSTQSAATFTVEKSDGTDVFTVSNAGDFVAGGGTINPGLIINGTDPYISHNETGQDSVQVDVDGGIYSIANSTEAVDYYQANTATHAIIYGSAGTTSHTFTSDGTGNAEFTFPADVIGDADIDWGQGAGQIGAVDIPLVDSFTFSDGILVTDVLQDFDTELAKIPDYYQFTFLPAGAILDDNNPPGMNLYESSGTGTVRFHTLDFDATTDEIVYWTFVVPDDMASGNWLADVSWFTNDTGATKDCYWEIAVSATTAGDADTVLEQAAGTSNTGSGTADATETNRLIQTTITMSNLDSVAAGDLVTFRFNRDANNASDDLTVDGQFIAMKERIPRA